ncbi:MAG: NmrA family NAD(P)-binding protein [Deltaproteobacteria bacterium]|nr:NmrA family NAD(P)-binding protein [Nannocystaceae bacterium]
MTFAVAGVTGNTGRVVAETLLAAGQPVRVIVRDREKAASFVARGAEVAVADLSDRDALTNALVGTRAAYLLVPTEYGPAPGYVRRTRAFIEAIVAAVVDARPGHTVVLSSIGANMHSGTGPIKYLHELEEALRTRASTPVTALRAAYFIENFAQALPMLGEGVLQTFLPAGLEVPMASTADIGRQAAALMLEAPPRAFATVEIARDAVTPNDIARAFASLLGRAITVRAAPLEALVPAMTSMGIHEELAEHYREMTQALITQSFEPDASARRVASTTPIETVLTGLLHADHVFASTGDSRVLAIDKDTGEAVTVGDVPGELPWRVAVDETHVYWTFADSGDVWSAPKP